MTAATNTKTVGPVRCETPGLVDGGPGTHSNDGYATHLLQVTYDTGDVQIFRLCKTCVDWWVSSAEGDPRTPLMVEIPLIPPDGSDAQMVAAL